jgi:hypothetical protein
LPWSMCPAVPMITAVVPVGWRVGLTGERLRGKTIVRPQ